MVLATHWLTTLIPTCNPRITQCAALSSGPGRETLMQMKMSGRSKFFMLFFMESINFLGDFGDEEKLEGGFGPPSWSKCASPSVMPATIVVQLVGTVTF